ncbi:glutamine--fructose-6-phosphate transaminase (isomerizing) [Rhizobium leguminosarum]|uniref:Glutamine--fructose-6-phosphate aminotransferase [isomerizing] n=1 Tax=Rhizobium leguminosarum TaxID=384 RepID=A0AAJ1AEJ1_RHILE|nr:glutamine--fructose-6-phosphate transaminase (isomerizing) [Rhizobium leguminosarum]MBY5537595.1 glutamine--fructose-6-phosphate transaminase (isomerizing) [Rhizobium leguminosarum]MBY5598586.1 glutamine--fructose-6-phosphate transaminase (isomerizing) [Rhizobium leguminosarum]MBY5611935.1 glutamine--fructose-6-phosphate transaminase (isomerizing) [Rhizobium leguminosarum]MBY5619345.1 glutamine--fructose-6-phosphate transaminase (isomerizing) [Rhizobium leguminosarum]MBY5632316.1 glutamine-
MCGIVGIVGHKPVSERLIEALERLEYRGYDSSGVATIFEGELHRRRAEGKLGNLKTRLKKEPLSGTVGIAHTRWATHGAPTECNAHPHFADGVAVVHNGIIENFSELKDGLAEVGAKFQTDTDTEVIAHLLTKFRRDGMGCLEAMHAMLNCVKGAFALAILFEDDPATIMVARNGPPLVIGHGDGEMFLGSDAIALAPFTNDITYLNDGDWAVVGKTSVQVFDIEGKIVTRPRHISIATADLVCKGNHRHFMDKEIYEQPEVIARALGHYIDVNENRVKAIAADIGFARVESLAISACGTAYLAGLVGKYWFERYARLMVEIDVASEFRYREIPLSPRSAALFISQSGETADTLASLRYCKAQGLRIGAVVNTRESTIAREADAIFPILAGAEIGVASTKAFTCQLAVLAALAIGAGRARGTITDDEEQALVQSLATLPGVMRQVLNDIKPEIEFLSRELSKCRDVLYLGRGTNFPLAMEGALKLKEVSYIHAEGYAAGELKHGPIALIDENMPVIVIAPHDRFFDKTVSNMQEVAARGGRIILITDETGASMSKLPTMHTIVLPNVEEIIAPMIFSLPLQLLAYHTAVVMGADVDQPRNLAKSVTVE